MIFQEQLVPHDPANGKYGDCFRATLASLLGKASSDVPHFFEDNPSGDVFNKRITSYLISEGYLWINIPAWDFAEWKKNIFLDVPVYHEICDYSPRFPDTFHSVVGCDGEVIHDPHPTKLGLPNKTESRTFGFLIKLCS